jgi:hypothetical protein
MTIADPVTAFDSISEAHAADLADLMEQDQIKPHEAAAGFAALAVIVAGEVLMILGAQHHDVPLAPLAQLVAQIFGA